MFIALEITNELHRYSSSLETKVPKNYFTSECGCKFLINILSSELFNKS